MWQQLLQLPHLKKEIKAKSRELEMLLDPTLNKQEEKGRKKNRKKERIARQAERQRLVGKLKDREKALKCITAKCEMY